MVINTVVEIERFERTNCRKDTSVKRSPVAIKLNTHHYAAQTQHFLFLLDPLQVFPAKRSGRRG